MLPRDGQRDDPGFVVTSEGEGEPIWFVNALVTIKVPGEAVDGRCTMIEFLMPGGHLAASAFPSAG